MSIPNHIAGTRQLLEAYRGLRSSTADSRSDVLEEIIIYGLENRGDDHVEHILDLIISDL